MLLFMMEKIHVGVHLFKGSAFITIITIDPQMHVCNLTETDREGQAR